MYNFIWFTWLYFAVVKQLTRAALQQLCQSENLRHDRLLCECVLCRKKLEKDGMGGKDGE